jgi:hypothetical protein
MPASLRAVIEGGLRAEAELSLLSGVCRVGEPLEVGPATDLTVVRHFKASLDRWRGAALRYLPDELEREVYTSTLSDIDEALREALARHKLSIDEFALLGESRCWAILDDMPFRRADMHLLSFT